MSTYRTGNHHGVTIVREGDGSRCGRPDHDCDRGHLVAVVVDGGEELAERICALLNVEPVIPEPIHLPWSYWDGTVETELRVDIYPYGGGVEGSGVQITLGQRRDGQIIAVRLPEESARRLALAILGGPE